MVDNLQLAVRKVSYRYFLYSYILGIFILLGGTGYYSYKTYEAEHLTAFDMEFQQARSSVEKAESDFGGYLRFLGKLISQSQNDRSKILQALRFDYLSNSQKMPEILDITFVPFNKSEAAITRLGEVGPQSEKVVSQANQHQSSFVFPFKFILRDPETQSNLGTIEGNRSYRHFIPQKLIATNAQTHEKCLQIILAHGQALYLAPPPTLTFFSYVQEKYKWVLLTLLTCIGFFFLSFSYSAFLGHRKKKRILKENHELRRNNEILMADLKKYKEKLDAKKHKYELLQEFHMSREEILNDTISRYQSMASQGLGINSILSKIFRSELNDNKTNMEIKNISDEVSVLMRKISKNHLMQMDEESINIKEEIQSVVSKFEILFTGTNTTYNIQGKNSLYWKADKGLLKYTLFNLLNLITSRLMKNNKIEIEIMQQDDLEIKFVDNGYLIENIENKHLKRNILDIGKKDLIQLCESLGWRVTFESLHDRNVIILYIPDQEKKNQGNIISMFKRVKHAT